MGGKTFKIMWCTQAASETHLIMREGECTIAAGVAIAVHSKLTAHDSLKVLALNHPAASGHCQKISLQPAGSDAVDIRAVYEPHDRCQT